MRLEGLAPRDPGRSVILEGVEEIRDQSTMVMMRKSHRVRAGAADLVLVIDRLRPPVVERHGQAPAIEARRSLAADEVDAVGKARIGAGRGADRAYPALRETQDTHGEIFRFHPV